MPLSIPEAVMSCGKHDGNDAMALRVRLQSRSNHRPYLDGKLHREKKSFSADELNHRCLAEDADECDHGVGRYH